VTIEDPGVYPEIENAFIQAGYAAVSQASTAWSKKYCTNWDQPRNVQF